MTTRYLFFSGKGGVGKTTMACATAVHYAESGLKTLIITTDPASNLADVFEREIGHKVTPLEIPNLWAMEIDPDRSTEEYRERILAPMRTLMPDDVMAVLEEQFNSPCTTEIASFDRFVDFMVEDHQGGGLQYDVVIFDTAPTGHTLRLLQLPVDWSRHIEESSKGGGNTCIGPVASIQENKKKYDAATRLLGDPTRTTFLFVLQPEATSLFETHRSLRELKAIGIQNVELIVNGLLPEEVCDHPFFRNRFDMQQRHLEEIRRGFSDPQRRMLQRDGEIKGLAALRHVALDLFARNGDSGTYRLGKEVGAREVTPSTPHSDPVLTLMRPSGSTKTIFFTGKGGVGKTTVSCAAALQLAEEGYKTLLLTTDPASHLGEVLEQDVSDTVAAVQGVENLYATIVDQQKATKAYKERILADARSKYDAEMLLAIREELESPCTEEMAAFDKFMQYIDSDDFDVVVFDTAPTGHTLRLLELPFDYSDQVGLMVATTDESKAAKAETTMRFQRIIARMRDREKTAFAFVVYPESTPIMEAERAMVDLEAAGISTQFLVANQVLSPANCTNDYFIRRLAMQTAHLHAMREQLHLPVAILPLLETEIRGVEMVRRAADALFGIGVAQPVAGPLT